MNDDWNKKDMATWVTQVALLSLVVALWVNVLIAFFGGLL
jgi:hypothetical protein